MKSFCIFTVVFLFLGICSVAAQDIIVLKDGNMIDAKVIEISLTEIRYKRSDNLDGPTIVIPADRVLSIKYKNGTQEIINATPAPEQKKTQARPVNTTPPIDPDKFIFAFNANPGGIISFVYGPSLCLEFGKGHFNSEVHLIFPLGFAFGGFGSLATFNYFWPKNYGGFYLGGGIGYIYVPSYEESFPELNPNYNGYNNTDLYITKYERYYPSLFTVGLNIGWKFVTRSGVYFRTGTYLGIAFGDDVFPLYFKPDLAIGYCFK